MLNSYLKISLGFLIFLVSACSSIYLPNVPNTPMLSKEGEMNAGAHITYRGNANINTAYAFSEHFGFLLNGSHVSYERRKKDFTQSLLETGIGYFTTFGKENNRILEIYTGFGLGSSSRNYFEDTPRGIITVETQRANLNKVFLQANYSSKRKRKLKLFGSAFPINYGTAIRVSNIHTNNFRINGVDQLGESNIFIEPVFFTRLKLSETVQLQYTSGSNFGLFNKKYLTAGNSVLSLGLVVNVGSRAFKQTAKAQQP